jgi:hypothetical protein
MNAFKLFRQRKDGSLGPLFINRNLVVPIGQWLPAEDHPTKGFAHRPGWHVSREPNAPHLSSEGRVWMQVEIKDYVILKRRFARAASGSSPIGCAASDPSLPLPQVLAESVL